MPGDVTAVVGNQGEAVGHQFQHPVSGFVAVGIIYLLEMIDIAERDAHDLGTGAGGAIGFFEQHFEGAAIGQAGQVVFLGTAAGLIQAAAQCPGLGLAAQHLLFDVTGAAHHHFGDGGEFRDHFAGLGHLLQFADMLFQRRMVLTGGAVGIVAGLGKLVDRAL